MRSCRQPLLSPLVVLPSPCRRGRSCPAANLTCAALAPPPPPPPPRLQLAQMINEKPQLINEYESGKAIPNPQVG